MTKRSSSLPSDARGKRLKYSINDNDRISKLPDDLLRMILSRLSTDEALKTSVLSTRWVDLWKWRSHLVLDMSKVLESTPMDLWLKVSFQLARSMTKTIKNHRGHLEICTIQHYQSQGKDGMLESWIQTLTRVKHTKDLTLVNYIHGSKGPYKGIYYLDLLSDAFSHHSLTSLSLCGFGLLFGSRGFKNCGNLKTLKLLNMVVIQAKALSKVFEACSSLEVIVLQIDFQTQGGVLKIDNKNLKFLKVTFPYKIDRMEVYATCLDVLDIRIVKTKKKFILAAPNIRFNKNYWAPRGKRYPHLSYNISDLAQKEKSIWHELMVSDFDDMRRHGSLSVSVDLTNPNEVEILKNVLLMWATNEMIKLEILFKDNNAPNEEGECSINGRAHKPLWEDEKAFPNTDFRVRTVWMFNFNGSNKEEFALASHFVKQKTVTKKMMIESSSFPPTKKLEVEAAVAKLIDLSKGNKGLSIQSF